MTFKFNLMSSGKSATGGSGSGNEEPGIDIWRDTPVRLLGYANEVGESFRYIAPWGVKPSYALAFTYVLCDCFDKGYKQYKC